MARNLIWCVPVLLIGLSGCGEGYRELTLTELQPLYVSVPSAPLPDLTSSPLGENYVPSGTVMDWKASAPLKIYSDINRHGQPEEAAGTISPVGTLSIQEHLLLRAEAPRALSKTFGAQQTATNYCGINNVKASGDPEVRSASSSYSYYLKDIAELAQSASSPALQPQTSPIAQYGRIQSAELNSGEYAQLMWTPEDVTIKVETECIQGTEQVNGSRNISQTKILINLKLIRGWNALIREYRSEFTAPNGVHVSSVVWSALPAEKLTRWKKF
ncbi:hypothetical protein E7T06_16530 [Deinococcus sp. Arct2-2]|uniref:hypothetical protein n=1 Tax=Deinococcus sp. Arct2-2 TaxID=2568653 RepID=UPI0010A3645B|nr:hypothetical protein [Deinococcus sp. Arct2-2]THF68434.1 hypothetical protein E7T06_16530 [Deinococcus sp. Arct2-2]